MRPARLHNLRNNEVERSPHRLFTWDTETHQVDEPKRQVHQLRIWAAETVQRHDRRPRQPRVTTHQGQGGDELLAALEGACRSSETVWAFAHNQSFDLAVTRLPLLLLRRGWTMTAHALATDSPWARLSRGSHRIVLADSTSWLPGALAGIGAQVSIAKPELPDQDGDPDDWWTRCRTDVRILSAALCELMDWWDARQLGCWSITGPQTGFNAMRHVKSVHTVVIDPDPAARQFERSAIMAGRREVWRVGPQPWGDYREIDFRSAHATVAANLPLPKRRSVHFDTMPLTDWRLTSDRWAPIAWCTIQTSTPRYPVTFDGRLFYPVGRFRTILCGPELADALERHELLDVGPGYVYQLGAHMGHWGRWVLDELAEPRADTPEVGRTAIKAWSRTVPGKWAARTGRPIHSGPCVELGWHLEHGRHHPSGAPVAVLDMAGSREIVLQDQEADDGFPAVLAWIQSHVRLRLGRLIDYIGAQSMLSCNTDGIVCRARSHLSLATAGALTEPLVPREKNRFGQVDVISPQHLILDRERRLSGIPPSAEEVAPRQFRWTTWPRMSSQIADGDPRGYLRTERTADLTAVPVNRWVLGDGTAVPVVTDVGDDGVTRLQRLPSADLLGTGWELPQPQHPTLQALLPGA